MIVRDEIISRAADAAFGKPLVTNVLRAIIVEAIVDAALSDEWIWCSADYAPWDFQHSDGAKLEVKQSAALQSWAAESRRVSECSFDIAERKGLWENGVTWIPGVARNASMYIFAHHPLSSPEADHREPGQWRFYVVDTRRLPRTRRIGLAGLRTLAEPTDIANLNQCVEKLRIELTASPTVK